VAEESSVISVNRQAYHDYFVEETYEAGIALVGTEVKSIRAGHVNLRGAYARVKDGEVWIEGMNIARYEQGLTHHDPLRPRKLLLHRREIDRLVAKVQAKGLTLVPLRLYFSHNRIKTQIGLCRGKKQYDKRDTLREREADREIARAVKQRLRS
jgi:SsrA-binding protein